MNQSKIHNFLIQNVSALDGVGTKIKKLLKKKKIEKISDLLWSFPQGFTDRSNVQTLDKLEIGKITTIKVKVKKYNFPRIRNLPNKVICEDVKGNIDIVFFNSREGYIRKILPLNVEITISGKVGFYKNKYQITNPTYVAKDSSLIEAVHNKYSLTEGISEKVYNKIISQILRNLPPLKEWHNSNILKKFNNITWNDSIIKLHDPKNIANYKSNFYRRLSYDEILSSFLVNSQIRKKIKKIKKISKNFSNKNYNNTISKLNFNLTNDQKKALSDVNEDLASKSKMFRLLQGDVGSGKTIVSLISALNVIESKFQVALMAPTEILAKQHYNLAKNIFPKNINIKLLSRKSENIEKKKNHRRFKK